VTRTLATIWFPAAPTGFHKPVGSAHVFNKLCVTFSDVARPPQFAYSMRSVLQNVENVKRKC